MGVHTLDSITVAYSTLSDKEYQEMRDEALNCLDRVVATGGNTVYEINPKNGDEIIEMNQEFLVICISIKSTSFMAKLQH